MATNQSAASASLERHLTLDKASPAHAQSLGVWRPLLAALCHCHPDPQRKDGRQQPAVMMEHLHGRPLLDDTVQ